MPEPMSDPMTWSLPVGRYFGIRVKVHLFFLLFLLVELLKAWGAGGDAVRITLIWSAILFFSVLLHEFGHCFAARGVGGDAEEILMWPLGGLASVSAPNTPRAQFIVTVWGPMVNVGICLATGGVLLAYGIVPPLNPFNPFALVLVPEWLEWVGFAFGINWILLLFNLIPAFPMDGGRLFRCVLWHPLGFARATLIAVQMAKICAIAMGLTGVLQENLLLVGVAIFVYFNSEMERRMLEAGMLHDESLFGYDFSQGYTSLTRTSPRAKARRPNLWQRFWRRRQRIKQQREVDQQRQEERQVDEILAKLHREGMASLTEQERRLLTRVSQKYRSRNQSGE